jgi:isopentenyl phosphate kinase
VNRSSGTGDVSGGLQEKIKALLEAVGNDCLDFEQLGDLMDLTRNEGSAVQN